MPQIYNCEDPYRRPGYLHIDPSDYKNTRWVPYTPEFLDAETPWYAEYPPPKNADIFFNETEPEWQFLELASTPKEWMKLAIAEHDRRTKSLEVEAQKQKAQDFLGVKDDGSMGWLWGRRLLIIGDSVDRYMMQFFCEEFGRQMSQPKPHTTALCEIPSLNFTLIHWHFPGSFTYKPDWWWMKDMKEIAFEERWKSMWAPMLDTHVRGKDGRPDLVLWQNGLWDQRALWEAGEAHFNGSDNVMGTRERQLVWDEVRFVASRMQKLAEKINGEFGADVPAMFRAITIHRDSNATDANLYELDRIGRAVGERNGHEVFEWGRIVTAMSMLYRDKTHTDKGPGSWLWGNMALEYLARGAGIRDPERSPYFNGWGACHKQLVHWGGR